MAQVSLYIKGKKVDADERTFGMRTFEIDETGSPKGMFYLNGESVRLRGANTMGFEQQDVFRYDYGQLVRDLIMAKICNMNFLRTTQRPVYEEVYYVCDRIGLMLQTDLPLFSVIRRTKFAEVVRQCEEMEKLIHDAETYQFQELSKRVKEAIDTLPASYREAFVMHRFTKKSYKEIAESSGVSVKTIAYRIQQATKLLRKDLADLLITMIVCVLLVVR